jgi:hypothetical protein
LRRMCQVLSPCQSAWPRRPEINIRLRCEQALARLPGPGKTGAEQARAGCRSLLWAKTVS